MRQHYKLRLQNDTKYREEHRSKKEQHIRKSKHAMTAAVGLHRAEQQKKLLGSQNKADNAARENSRTAMLQKKMASNSGVPLLDVKLLTKKAEQRQKTWTKNVDSLSFKSGDKSYLLFGTVAS